VILHRVVKLTLALALTGRAFDKIKRKIYRLCLDRDIPRQVVLNSVQ